MQYKYFYVAKLLGGFNIPPDANEAELASCESMRAFLRRNVDTQLADLDRSNAIGTLMLKGLFGQPVSKDYDVCLAAEIAAVKEARTKQVGNSNVLFVEFTGTIDVSSSGHTHERDDYVVCFDAVEKSIVRQKHQHDIEAVKFAIAVACDSLCRFHTLVDELYLLNDEGKKVYSYTFSMGSPNVFTSRALTDGARDRFIASFRAIVDGRDTDRITQLFSLMADNKTDKFRAFLFGWTALEIFINKTFHFYHKQFVHRLSNGVPALRSAKYFERIKDVMKDKFTLLDKFRVISSVLIQDSSGESDVDQFTLLKELRDNLFHGKSIVEQTLPVCALDILLRKYIAAHSSQTRNAGANSAER